MCCGMVAMSLLSGSIMNYNVCKSILRKDIHTFLSRSASNICLNDYISNGILRSEPGFLLRVETHLDAENILIITLGDTKPGMDTEHGAVIFDIDRIVEREILTGQEVLEQEMDRLHTDTWKVFSSAKSEKLETLLNRRQQ